MAEQRSEYALYDRRQGGARPPVQTAGGPANLADILERVLDKGIVIAGDIQINLLDIELLTIKLRLLVASVERAQEMGINWWESDPTLSGDANRLEEENRDLRERLERLEQLPAFPSRARARRSSTRSTAKRKCEPAASARSPSRITARCASATMRRSGERACR
jgi:hypothetical protein